MRNTESPFLEASLNIYMAISTAVGMWCLVRDTINAYNSGGPIAGAFWFFTIGPIVSFFEGLLWPITLCMGCMGF